MRLRSLATLLLFLALVGITAASGISFRPGPWYEALAKPDWTPPNWLFAPVWTVLYVMIAIAGWRVYERQGLKITLMVWLAALVLNGLWSGLMFGQHLIGLAVLDIGALWILVAAFIALAWTVDRAASLLFVPYLIWISYAAALNVAVYQLNTTT